MAAAGSMREWSNWVRRPQVLSSFCGAPFYNALKYNHSMSPERTVTHVSERTKRLQAIRPLLRSQTSISNGSNRFQITPDLQYSGGFKVAQHPVLAGEL
jgi:hypothetical protein